MGLRWDYTQKCEPLKKNNNNLEKHIIAASLTWSRAGPHHICMLRGGLTTKGNLTKVMRLLE